MSRHSAVGVNCLDCHQPSKGQEPYDHKGFTITKKLSAANCQGCHPEQYKQYLQSRHAAPAWAASGASKISRRSRSRLPRSCTRGPLTGPHELTKIEGLAAVNKGCRQCHDVAGPTWTARSARARPATPGMSASVALARLPETCGQCHMGPDHAQLEIYHESKHGVLFNAQRGLNLDARPDS